jgi:bifunctional DNA-binding transcriptional regulator/antitoxin component of YhaV-PrlF toxin-antitoxin module
MYLLDAELLLNRRRLGVGPNDKIAIIFRDDGVIFKPLKGTIKIYAGYSNPQTTGGF